MWGEGEERRGNVEGEKGERGEDTVERCSVAGGKSMIPSRRWEKTRESAEVSPHLCRRSTPRVIYIFIIITSFSSPLSLSPLLLTYQ